MDSKAAAIQRTANGQSRWGGGEVPATVSLDILGGDLPLICRGAGRGPGTEYTSAALIFCLITHNLPERARAPPFFSQGSGSSHISVPLVT